jgi:hypothetical protein
MKISPEPSSSDHFCSLVWRLTKSRLLSMLWRKWELFRGYWRYGGGENYFVEEVREKIFPEKKLSMNYISIGIFASFSISYSKVVAYAAANRVINISEKNSWQQYWILNQIANSLQVKLDNGTRIIQQGDDGDCLYVIEEGKLVRREIIFGNYYLDGMNDFYRIDSSLG